MDLGYDGLRLRIFIYESLRREGMPLYKYIVVRARQEGLAGATVFRAIEGYGARRHVHSNWPIDAVDDFAMIVEVVDRPDAIHRFIPILDDLVAHGIMTLSPVQVVRKVPLNTSYNRRPRRSNPVRLLARRRTGWILRHHRP